MRRQAAFTLIEMMMAIAVMAVLLAVAVPSFTGIIRSQRVKTAAFDLQSSLVYARSEAIKRSSNVDLVPVSTSDWASGWSIVAGSTTLRTQQAFPSVSIAGPTANVTYQRSGRLTNTSAPSFTVKSSESDSTTARCVNVDLSGRPIMKVDTNNSPADGCQ